MTSRLIAVAVDARDPLRLAQFWAQLLGCTVVENADGPDQRCWRKCG